MQVGVGGTIVAIGRTAVASGGTVASDGENCVAWLPRVCSVRHAAPASGGEYRWFLTRAVSVRDAEGCVTAWFGTTTDIHDRKRAEAERAQLLERERVARAEAQEAVRIRDIFLSVASHELKTPLTSLLGQAQLLLRRAERGSTMREQEMHSINVIATQASRLNKMILALLDVSRLETGQLSIERASLDLGALTRQVVTEMQPTLEKHTLTYHGPDVPY